MAITEQDYLHIHKGESTFLMLRGPEHYHMIWIDARWSEAALQKLLRMYPCSEDMLRKQGFRASAFKAENLRFVNTRGTQTGDELELWVGSDLRQYTFGSDYTPEWLDAFFSGAHVHHRQIEQWKGLPISTVRRVTWGLNGFSIILAIVFFAWGSSSRFLGILCALCQLSAVLLPVFFPESFTLEEETIRTYHEKRKYRPGKLTFAWLAPCMAMSLRTVDFEIEDRYLFLAMGIMAILAGIAFVGGYFKSIRVRTTPINYMLLVVCLILFGYGTVFQLNYALDFHNNPSYEVGVVDKREYRGSKSTSFYCSVELPNGEIKEFSVSGSVYEQTDIGEDVLITDYAGAFGIPFSTLEPIEED